VFFHCLLIAFLLGALLPLQAHFSEIRFKNRVVVPECPWCDVRPGEESDVVFLPIQEKMMRLFAPADPNFLADLLWLQTCYYFGARSLTSREYPYLFNMLDLITDLAPRWDEPFLFGAAILPTEGDALGDGLYMIDKGLVFHPDNWRLWFFKGFYFWNMLGDYEGASEALLKAAKQPDAPAYLGPLSATIASRSGQREFALRFIQEALQALDDETQREALLQKMRELANER
jgi:tetratricopeptide (TPR) repeat protein